MHRIFVVVFALLLLHSGAAAQISSIPEAVHKDLCERFERGGPKVGEHAPDFTFENVNKGTVHLADLWAKKPLVLISGSYSCPYFRLNIAPMNALVRDFGSRANFVTLYTIEAHPSDSPGTYSNHFTPEENVKEGIAAPQAKTLAERLDAARRCRVAYGLTSILAVDTMDNAAWKAYGNSMNCAYLIGTDGTVILQQGLFNPATLRAALAKLPSH